MTANEDTRGTAGRATVIRGNPGTLVGTQDVRGEPYARYRATPGTWVSASLKEQGYGPAAGYGAYAGLVRSPDGKPLPNPDRIAPGQEYLVPLRAPTVAPPPTANVIAGTDAARGVANRYGTPPATRPGPQLSPRATTIRQARAAAPMARTPGKVPVRSPASVFQQFILRAAERRGSDTGGRPGFLERRTSEAVLMEIELPALVGGKLVGKDYTMARRFLNHYLTQNGDPLLYEPPEAVRTDIAKHFPAAGHYSNVNPYNWGNPDIRNGLGHFDLDVFKVEGGRLEYMITDRYSFPSKDGAGKPLRHGFQVGKLSPSQVKSINERLAALGDYRRDDGSMVERFAIEPSEKKDDYTLVIPQKWLADHGVDYESLGAFEVAPPAPPPSR